MKPNLVLRPIQFINYVAKKATLFPSRIDTYPFSLLLIRGKRARLKSIKYIQISQRALAARIAARNNDGRDPINVFG